MVFFSSAAMAQNFEVDGVKYHLNGDKCEVSRQNISTFERDVVIIPEYVEYEGKPYPVTSIGEWAFTRCSSLTGIVIPKSVTNIEHDAFGACSSLTSIVVEEGNTKYDSRDNCNAIIETESNALIYGCSTTIIPKSVTSIKSDAFYGCSSLTSISIPKSVTNIGTWAFAGCSSLTSIVVEEGNAKYDSRDNCNAIIETESNALIYGCSTTTIPKSVTSINAGAFCECYSLTNIVIPESVTSIGEWAFAGCSSLTSITIPKSVTHIDDRAIIACPSLTNIMVEEGNTKYDSRDNCNAIIETENNALILGCSTTIIPKSVTSIASDAFAGCSSLTSIVIPESVKSINNSAFFLC